MSLFGSSSTAAKPGAFTFGAATPTAPATSTASLFGPNTTPTKPLFGSTSQPASTPSLFGATTTTTTTATTGATGGLFGGTTTSTTPSNTGATSLFTKRPATTNLFATTSAPTTTPAASGGLFGGSQHGQARPMAEIAPLNNNNVAPRDVEHLDPVRGSSPTPPPQDPIHNQPQINVTSMTISIPVSVPQPPPPPPQASPRVRLSPRRKADEPLDEGLRAPKMRLSSTSALTLPAVFLCPSTPPAVEPTRETPILSQPHQQKSGFSPSLSSDPSQNKRASLLNLSDSHNLAVPERTDHIPRRDSGRIASTPPMEQQKPKFVYNASTSNSCIQAGATFGSTTTPGTSLFTNPKPATGGGLFGSTATTTQQQQPQQPVANSQQQAIQNFHPLVKAIGNPQLLATEDDKVMAHINQVGAALNVGKLPYKENNQLKTYNLEDGNFFSKFVGIGYNKISDKTDDEGIVTLVLKVGIDQLNTVERKVKVLDAILNILGNQQNLRVEYAPGSQFRPLFGGSTEISIIVKEGGFIVSALKLAQVLNDANRLTQLETQLKVDRTAILPKVGFTKAQKENYLTTPPHGVDAKVWLQAVKANPAPNKMVPVVIRGWEELRHRQRSQIAERKVFQNAVESLADRIEKVETDHARAQIEMEAIRCRHKQLSYRLLRILLAQWITQRFSKQIDTDEDKVEAQCDTLLAKLNRHNQLQAWIQNFYHVLETKAEQLLEGAGKMYDMSMDHQLFSRKVLSEILYIGERLIATNELQMEDLEAIRRTLAGE